MNTLFALERYRAHPTSTVIASGGVQPPSNDGYPEGAVIRDALVRNHVPADRIVVEGQSTTTREQAVATARILRQLGSSTCIVVTSPQQMDRALDLFAHEGIKGLPLYRDVSAVVARQRRPMVGMDPAVHLRARREP